MSSSRLVVFAGFAALAAAQWATLLFEPRAGRFVLVVVAALAAAALLIALGARAARGPLSWLATAGVAIACVAAGLSAIGLPADQFPPWHWDRLAVSIEEGFAGLRGDFDYPLRSGNELARAILVAALPVLLALAAVLGFRPGASAGPANGALIVLIAAFAIPATARPTTAPVLWGLALLALTAMWIWGARMRAPTAIALLCVFGGVGASASGALAAEEPPIDYEGWTLNDDEERVEFRWDHSYGPIDWPRNGTPLFRVESDRPGYWRAETLDDFYSTAWRRSTAGGAATPEPTSAGARPSWNRSATFTMEALESSLLLSPGTAFEVDGVEGVERESDGTLISDESLRNGTEYTVSSYAPNPAAPRLRSSGSSYPEVLGEYTSINIPVVRPEGLTPEAEIITPETLDVPLWGSDADPAIERAIELSPYRRVERLTRRLVAGERTPFDAARAVEAHLKENYEYRESPPVSLIPLRSFLFADRAGYCQQFSGAMALMLRMAGIPARVAVGFTAGTPVGDPQGPGEEFVVTDLDAHSWVEVYFDGIGWVTFDPTPGGAPAESQLGDLGAGAFRLNERASDGPSPVLEGSARERAAGLGAGEGGDDGSSLGIVLAGVVGVAGLAGLVASLRALRHRRLSPARAADLQLAELPPALRATGRGQDGSATLLELEATMRAERRTGAAGYMRSLRDNRFRAVEAELPSLSARRAARKELGEGRGLLARLRLLAAMPPGGPRVRRHGTAIAHPLDPHQP